MIHIVLLTLLLTAVSAQWYPHEGTVLALYETVTDDWEETFKPDTYSTSFFEDHSIPKIFTEDHLAYNYNYTCRLYSHCDLALYYLKVTSQDACEDFQPKIECLPDLAVYEPTFLGMDYENLTTLWCEKITSDGTIILTSNIEKDCHILKNSCFLVVKTVRQESHIDGDFLHVLIGMVGLFFFSLGILVYLGQLDMPFV